MIRLGRIVVFAVLTLFAAGCALIGGSPPERYGGRATLSGAAAAASDSSGKKRRLDVGDEVPKYPDWSDGGVRTDLSVSGDGTRPGTADDGAPGDGNVWHVGAIAGGGTLGGAQYEGFGLGGLDIGASIGRTRADLGLIVLSPNLTAASVAGEGLVNEMELAADFSVRYYLTPPHTFLGLYPLAGMRFGTLFWDYRTPVQVIADGGTKTLKDDYLNYYGLYGGLGISLVQTRHFSTGVQLTGGFRAYDETTFEGFRNNLFPTTGYTQLAYEAVIRF